MHVIELLGDNRTVPGPRRTYKSAFGLPSQRLRAFVQCRDVVVVREHTIPAAARDLTHDLQTLQGFERTNHRWDGELGLLRQTLNRPQRPLAKSGVDQPGRPAAAWNRVDLREVFVEAAGEPAARLDGRPGRLDDGIGEDSSCEDNTASFRTYV